MADQADWKGSLKASQRYDNIQAIQKAIQSHADLAAGRTAFAIENDAYQSASSRKEYNDACDLSQNFESAEARQSPPPFCNGQAGGDDHDGPDGASKHPGERIGPYQNCLYLASGVTAEVYRCNDRALKVITENHNIEPHNPSREVDILSQLRKPCIPLLDTFRDQEQRLTLVFPYMPLTLSSLLDQGALSSAQIRIAFNDLFQALKDIHSHGIIHRDIKPQAILLASPEGPAYLSDFGTAWHPESSVLDEPAGAKILDIGTGPYRAPEVLFGDRSYSTAVDMWSAGCMLAECARKPPKPLFESRPVHEDGNQLGLILSIFKTIGSPTRETWPEAQKFRTPPFDLYRVFEGRPWEVILDGVDEGWADMVKKMVKYDSSRMTAEQALNHPYMQME